VWLETKGRCNYFCLVLLFEDANIGLTFNVVWVWKVVLQHYKVLQKKTRGLKVPNPKLGKWIVQNNILIISLSKLQWCNVWMVSCKHEGANELKGIELNLLSFLQFIDVLHFMCVRCLCLCHVMVVLCWKVCGLFQLVHLNPSLLQCSWNKLWPPKASLLKHITLSKISSIKNSMQSICLETHQVLKY
jgi:hypothetical protein